jgi:A/G-specific adenine glycosylase
MKWADRNVRDFPWRRTKDPYNILVAEVMLQRTKAEQVAPVYVRFISKYPDFNSLSEAPVTEIRDSITSLGLEKRAIGLKKLAEQMVKQYHCRVPRAKDELLKLHWVGNYIANAVLCYSFGIDAPTVDANFARVFERVFSLKLNSPAQKDKRVWTFAESMMPYVRGRCRIFNLGILDLASEICTPKKPSCAVCPLNMICDYGVSILAGVGLFSRKKRS